MLRVLGGLRARSLRAAAAGLGVAALLGACGGDDGPAGPPDGGFVFVDARAESGPSACESDVDCGDLIACTIDHCRGGVCTHDPCTDCCDEGLECREDVGCAPAAEACARDADCGDGIRCTIDRCRDETSCEHAPQPELCDDGEVCLALAGCVPRPPDTCSGVDDCLIPDRPCLADWACDPEFGCQLVGLVHCDDGDACTVDRCDDAAGGCVTDPLDADGDGASPTDCGGGDCDDEDPARGPDAAESCNGIDDDCDGELDEGCCVEGEPCTTECGTTGERACEASGAAGRCVAPREVCNGEDEDCDGEVDETFDCRAGQTVACTTACGSPGTRTCTDACSYGPCGAGTEICNGLDDDCNGLRDDGFDCIVGSMVGCTTACGSTGTAMCGGDCTAGACAPPAETCNGRDDDCDGAADQTFACVAGSSTSCMTTCGSTGTRACLPGCTLDACVPPTEVCNGVDDDCDTTCDDGFTCCAGASVSCSSLGMGSGTAVCRADCSGYDTGACGRCGNGTIESPEQCDGSNLAGQGCTTIPGGYTGGTLRCSASCTFDASACERVTCGNGRLDSGEQCDGALLGGATCTSIPGGYTGGTLGCRANCTYDTAACTGTPTMTCGNNLREGSEPCDGTDLAGQTCASRLGAGYTGTLSCNPGCTSFNTSGCMMTGTWDPTGTYSGPTVANMCACVPPFGCGVNFSFTTWSFSDNGTTLWVTFPGLPCTTPMTGGSPRMSPSRSFVVTCTFPGMCSETYTLSGSFGASDNMWSGTFSMGYSGSCLDCSSQVVAASGSR